MNQLDLFSSNKPKKRLQQKTMDQPENPVKLKEQNTNDTPTEIPLTMSNTALDTIMFLKEEWTPEPSIPKAKKKTHSVPKRRGRKPIQIAGDNAINIPADEVLFQKQYYTISEVADMFDVNTSLIRFWENEFDTLKPRKNKKGDRLFSPTEIKKIELIHHLLRNQKFTIPGAKEYLKKNKHAEQQHSLAQSLQQIKNFLLELKATIQS